MASVGVHSCMNLSRLEALFLQMICSSYILSIEPVYMDTFKYSWPDFSKYLVC